MCTVVVLFRPGHAWPLLLAANRDEQIARAWDMPAAHWPEYPGVVAGRDRTAGGTWMAVGRQSVVATVLNRQGSLGPLEEKRSRGELPLRAAACATAFEAAEAIAELDPGQWRSFNMVLADRNRAIFLRGLGAGQVEWRELEPGCHMVTAHDVNDPESPRVARHLNKFATAHPPAPPDWSTWPALLSDRSGLPGEQINVLPRAGFGTVSSSLFAIPATGPATWLFAAGSPETAPFLAVEEARLGSAQTR